MTCSKCGGYASIGVVTKEGGFTKINVCRSCLATLVTELRRKNIEFVVREAAPREKRRGGWL